MRQYDMKRLLAALLLSALPVLGLSLGDMETGVDFEVDLPSGDHAKVATWVLAVDTERHFEAFYERSLLPSDRGSTYRDLKHIREALVDSISAVNATDITVHVCTDSAIFHCATCFWQDTRSANPTACFHSDE